MTGYEREKTPEDAPEQERRSGMLNRTRNTAGALGRWYVRSQFGDVKGFVAEQKRFGRWLMRYMWRRDGGRHESFDDAMDRLGLDENDLMARQAALERVFWMYGVVAVVAFGLLVGSPFVKHSASQFLLSLGVFLFMGARCAVTRFRVVQIRQRRFMGFLEWIRGEDHDGRAVR